MQYDARTDPTVTVKQTRLVATDAATPACFCEAASPERSSGSGLLAAVPALRDFAGTPFDSSLIATLS
jgi:hypothetical protein